MSSCSNMYKDKNLGNKEINIWKKPQEKVIDM
jgi:hypothetical protein